MLKITVVVAAAMIASAGGLNARQRHCQTASDSAGHVMEGGGMMGMMQGGMMRGGMMQGGGGMMEMMPVSGAMMRGMQLAPARVKALGDNLDLTAEQIGALDQLIEQTVTVHRELKASVTAAGERLTELFDAETVDSAAVRATALEVLEPQAAMHAQMLADAAAVQQILAASQREKLKGLAKGSHCRNDNR